MYRSKIVPGVVILTAVIMLLPAIYGWSTSGFVRSQAYAQAECPKVSMAWQAGGVGLRSFGFSDAGNHFYILNGKASASVYSSSGTKRFDVDLGKANRLAVAPDAGYAMAYAHLNPVNSTVTFFNSEGKRVWDMEVEGAVWSTGVCPAGDTTRFVVGTGDRYVYVIDISDKSKKYRRWRAPGAVVSLNVDPDGEFLTLGTWQKSSVTRCTLSGKRLWSTNASPKDLQYVEHIHAPDRVVVRSVPNKAEADGTFALFDGRGKAIWSGRINTAEHTRVLHSPSGRYVCLSYEKKISHKGETTSEKHAALFDYRGHKLWDKGSLFFHPQPLAVTSQGCVVISNEKNALFVVDREGELEPSIKLSAAVVRSVVSPDGSRILVECSNGKVYMLRIS